MRSVLLSAVVGLSALGLPLAGTAAPQSDAVPAKIRVMVPADATLTFDGEPTKMTSADRTFVTPPLDRGKDYYYNLKAQFVRGDDTVTVERRITVRAGQDTNVSLGMPGASSDNVAYYYDPTAPAADSPSRAYYYDPSVPFFIAPDLDVPRGGVAPARDNWKPDFSDPFITNGPG